MKYSNSNKKSEFRLIFRYDSYSGQIVKRVISISYQYNGCNNCIYDTSPLSCPSQNGTVSLNKFVKMATPDVMDSHPYCIDVIRYYYNKSLFLVSLIKRYHGKGR